jgi:hypothetical protein
MTARIADCRGSLHGVWRLTSVTIYADQHGVLRLSCIYHPHKVAGRQSFVDEAMRRGTAALLTLHFRGCTRNS